jgi:excisionase family DNA binding protein
VRAANKNAINGAKVMDDMDTDTMETKNTFEPLIDSHEAAALLKIDPMTLQRMARAGEAPAIKVGKLWRFRKSALDEWLASKVSFFRHPCRK